MALGAAVACWVAGFDLFYALLDLEVDRAQGLHSWATRFGDAACSAARACCTRRRLACLAAAGLGLDVGVGYWLGVAASRRCSSTSTRSSGPDDLRRLDAAFFTVNGVISVVFFAFVLLVVLHRHAVGPMVTWRSRGRRARGDLGGA